MELEGLKGLVDTGRSSGTSGVPPFPFVWSFLMCSRAFLAPKMAAFSPKLQFLKPRSATCETRFWPPPSSSLLRRFMIVLHTYRYHAPKFQPNPKHHYKVLMFTRFARAAACLLAACCLLACLLLLLNLGGPPQTLKRVMKPRLVPPAR